MIVMRICLATENNEDQNQYIRIDEWHHYTMSVFNYGKSIDYKNDSSNVSKKKKRVYTIIVIY